MNRLILAQSAGLEGPLDAGGVCPVTGQLDAQVGGYWECQWCGQDFPPGLRNRKYCSVRCQNRAYNQAHPVVRQRSLFPLAPVPKFDGSTVEPEDVPRLAHQLDLVRWLMGDGCWRTLSEIGTEIGAPEASVSARLRDLRKARFGGHKVERKRLSRGLFTYRVQP